MGCCSSKEEILLQEMQVQEQQDKPVTVENVLFFRSDSNGNPGEQVKAIFKPSGTDFSLSYLTTIQLNFCFADLKIHARCILSHVLVGSKGRVPEDYEIVACDLQSKELNVIDTHAELPRAWPVGDYELRIFINDALVHCAPFIIR
ncbi:MAG: hypothetical protein EZS28_003933 [Streblomastix strix]|uniref:Uncharacterized protein n=1 Tax=Streblomastix strix TaxID=222440 RepID=A0A5J4X245_9EUKA|nr:MAG: hypothetical protein EZS28_003933 [Streblomastix strix]